MLEVRGSAPVGVKKREMERQRRRKRRYLLVAGAIGAVAAVAAATVIMTPAPGGGPNGQAPGFGVIHTASGVIVFRFYETQAPITAPNFIGLFSSGYYNGLPWHRVVAGFVIQTGDKPSDPRPTIPLEPPSQTGLSNTKGTLAVARTDDPNSGSTQFYINLGDNTQLDTTGGGYAVFGIVTCGMEVAAKVPQGEIISSVSFVRQATAPACA